MLLADRKTGEVSRGPRGHYEARYRNLARSFHNNLRITRILKCLGEMGLEHMKRPFVEHVLREVYLHGELVPCRISCIDYWAQTLRSEDDRAAVAALAEQLHRCHPPRGGG